MTLGQGSKRPSNGVHPFSGTVNFVLTGFSLALYVSGCAILNTELLSATLRAFYYAVLAESSMHSYLFVFNNLDVVVALLLTLCC